MDIDGHHIALIAENTSRIATALETMLERSKPPTPDQYAEAVTKAINAMKEAVPAFGMAFEAIEKKMIEEGPDAVAHR